MIDVLIRELQENDLFNGFLESLDTLRNASSLKKEKAKIIFNEINSNPYHKIMVAIINQKIVGTTTLLIEKKFIHDGGLVGHIEDVVVSKDYQGKNIGKKLLLASLDHAKKIGCYKTILDCTDDLIPFYEKIGFKKHSSSMRYNHF